MMKKVLLYQANVCKSLTFLWVMVFAMGYSFAQNRQVAGKITASDDGSTIPGVSILIKGTTTGTVSDVDGKFSISVPDQGSVLVFSNVGYTSQEVAVGNQSVINVALVPDVKSLSEVVVIGYGTQERKDVTGAISSVTAAQIEKVPVTTIDQALQGRSTGVQVTNNDGSPGSGVSIRIRGTGTFGDNSPLYVVDGYPISGGLANLNPSDIASMDILKDASATAIYGSRASNGVVIITTKRGNKNGIQVSFDGLTSYQAIPTLYNVLNAQQFASFVTEIADQESYPVLPEWRDPASLRTIDWQKEMYQPGLRQNYNLALRGGNEKVQGSFSLGYLNQRGVVKLSEFKRYNASLNIDFTPNSRIKASASLKYTRGDGETRFGTGLNTLGILTKLAPTMTGNPLTDQVKDANGNYGYFTKGGTAVAGMTNVVADVESQDRRRAANNLLASGFVEVDVWKGIKLKTNLGINTSDNSGYYFTPSHNRSESPTLSYYSQYGNNTFEWLWENTVAYSKTFGKHSVDFVGGISAQENTFRQMGTEGNGSVSDELRSVGSITTITRSYGNQQTWSLYSQFARLSYKFNDKYILTGTVRRDGSSRFASSNQFGVFPSVSAAWKIKEEPFLANVNFLSDLKIRGSWGKSGNQNIDLFLYESTYGPGPDRNDNRDYVFGRNKAYAPGIILKALPNPGLKWETTTQSDIGVDAAFLQNRLSLTADYYSRVSSGFLLDVQVPVQTGYPTATKNVGSIKNSGLELGVEFRESSREFKWAIGANVTTLNNKIQNFADGLKAVSNFSNLGFPDYGSNTWKVFSQSQVGGPVGAFYGFQSAGILQSQEEIDALNANAAAMNKPGTWYIASSTSPGDRNFVDQLTVDTNGDGIPDAKDGVITDADRVIIGSPIPDFFGGVNVDASYKQFDFTMFWYASVGNDILNYAKRNLQSLATNGGVGVENVSEDFYLNRWTPTNPSNTYARAVRDDKSGNTRVSDVYVEDGSYFRLRNVQIGYTLPSTLLSKVRISKVRVYVSGQNLLTFTKYSGLDPEIGEATDPNANRNATTNGTDPNGSGRATANGIDLGSFPTSRYFTVGLNVQF